METPKSQTPQTARLARKIRRARERRKGGKMSWKDVCTSLHILKDDGNPDTGMAYKIGYEEYEPSGRPARQRLGLRDICTRCRRAYRIPRAGPPPAKTPARAWWDRLKGEDREKLIELAYRNYLNWKKKHGG